MKYMYEFILNGNGMLDFNHRPEAYGYGSNTTHYNDDRVEINIGIYSKQW